MVLLPGYYLWTKARCDLGLNLDSSWSDAARSANNLYLMLARPDAKTLPTAEDFRKPAAELERLLSRLADPFSEANAARILRKEEVAPTDYLEVQALLAQEEKKAPRLSVAGLRKIIQGGMPAVAPPSSAPAAGTPVTPAGSAGSGGIGGAAA